MIEHMFEHLKLIVVSAIFNPALLIVIVLTYLTGRVLGSFMPWDNLVKPMVILFVIGIFYKLFISRSGYDLYIIFGFPFMAGLWSGSRKS